MGRESEAVPNYEKSLKVFDQAIQEFPQNRALKIFRALTLYNLGKAEQSVGELLVQLVETTRDSEIKSYERAIKYYSDKLDQTWK